ncbi:cytotoxic [Ruminiclostridium hungatei]|uniref:Cytotoxic n=1 Tax=Ruminiclostridium hungatei TaxID=48256 RepID=A0A1V4SFU5_RUMHU|nr:cytotoxic [Ruminiclostridium hungatei]
MVVGNEVLDSSGNVLLVENIKVEITNEPTKVYNFQVDDFHTYHVGKSGILVHNADYIKENRVPKDNETVLKDKTSFTRTSSREKGATIYKGKDGNYYHRDTLHKGKGAELEVYDSQGKHIGTAEPLTGKLRPGTAVAGRKIKI